MTSMAQGVRRERLDNGLTVLVRRDRSAPVAAVVTWVRSGYFQEDEDQVGLAHVCEHVYFNGTTRRPGPEDIAREVKGLGGELNAGTYYDSTSYYVVLPADRFEQALDVQADAFANPKMDEEVLEKEIGAIIQEANRKLDNPAAVARERMYESAFDVHRMRRWRIGTEEQLRSYRPADLRRFWEAHYVPENAVVAVVGDVDEDRALSAVNEGFGRLPARAARRECSPPEPERAKGLRHARSLMDVREVSAVVGFPTVGEGHPDAIPLAVLAAVLSEGRSSRLVQELRERRGLVSSVSAASHHAAEVGFFDLSLSVAPERLGEAREALFEALGEAWRIPPNPEELERARNGQRAEFVFAGSTMLGQARSLAAYEARGDYRLLEQDLRDLLAVEADDVLRVARTWLVPSRAVLHEVVPEKEAPASPEPGELERVLSARAGHRPEPAEAPADRVDAPALVLSAGGGGTEDWSRSELASGLHLVHRRNPGLPTAALVASFGGGRRGDEGGRAGRTRLAVSLLPRGTRQRSSEELSAAVEGLGSSLSTHVGDDQWGMGLGLLTEHVEEGAGLLFEALLTPAFDQEELERARRLQLQALLRLQDQPLALALELGRQAAFADQLPGQPALGTEESLRVLDASSLAEWHASELTPEAAWVAVVGDVSSEEARRLVERGFEGAALSGRPVATQEREPSFHEGAQRRVERRKQQTAQAILFPGVPAGHEDAPVLDLLAACASGLGGRFFEEVRTKRGLAYVVAASAAQGRSCGWFSAFLATSPADETQARDVLLHEARRLADEPPEGEELRRAQEYLCGRHALGLQGNAAQAGAALGLLGAGLGLDELERRPERIRAVTTDRLAEAARRFLDPDRVALGIVAGGVGEG